MTLEEQLKREILSRYKSIREFSSITKVPYSTIDSVLKRGIKNSGVGTVIKIFSYLDIDVESITSGTLKHINSLEKTQKSPSAAEAAPGDEIENQIMDLVRRMLPEQKALLLALLHTVLEQTQGKPAFAHQSTDVAALQSGLPEKP